MSNQQNIGEAEPGAASSLGVGDYLLHLLAGVARVRDNRLNTALQPLGLNITLYRALDAVARFEPCTMTETATFSYIDRTTATRTVDQLARLQLVERVDCPADRRHVLLALTHQGRARHSEAAVPVAGVDREALADVSEGSSRSAIAAARSVITHLALDADEAERLLKMRRSTLPSRCAFAGQPGARCSLQCRTDLVTSTPAGRAEVPRDR